MTKDELEAKVNEYVKLGLIESGKEYWHDFKRHEFYIPLAAYSDHSGSSVEKSNCIYFLYKFKFLTERYLAYHGSSVVFSLDDLWEAEQENAESVEEFFSDLDSLENYPVLDENLMCEIEFEVQQEVWDSCYRHDFICELQSLFNLNDDDFDTLVDNPDGVSALFVHLCDSTNTYWEMEGPSSAYIDIERVAAGATIEDINEILGRD